MYKNFKKYEIFEDGRVYSYKSKRFLKPRKNDKRGGYNYIKLSDNNGDIKNYRLHKVIYEAIKGEIPDGYEINHKSENKDENFISNLELVTHKANCNWGTRTARAAEKQKNDPNRSKQVAAYRDGVLVMTFPSTAEAGRNGFQRVHISECCNGKLKTHKGYQWLYFDESPPLFYIAA